MSVELKKLHEEMSRTWEEMKNSLEVREQEVKQLGEVTVETKNYLDRLNDRIDTIDARLQAANFTKQQNYEYEESAAELKEATLKALRHGYEVLEPSERKQVPIVSLTEAKALNLSSDTAGGFLAYPEMVAGILKELQLISPVRQYANVKQTSSKALQYTKRTGTFAARWVGERENRTETTGLAWDMLEVPNYEMYADVIISEQLLEDSAFDFENEIVTEAGIQFGIAEAQAFINGDGIKKPEGFMFNSDVAYVPSGDANKITADGLMTLFYGHPQQYATNARFYTQRINLRDIRQLKDTMGNSIWQPALALDVPSTILGAPYTEMPDMDAIAPNSYPVVFGQLDRAYLIVDRVNMVVKRLNETGAKQGVIEFLVRRRVGGQIITPKAIRKLKISVS